MSQPVYGGDTHWRNSMKPARFFFMDARAAVPFVFTLLHLRWYTMLMALFTTLIFYLLEQRGMSFDAALRGFRVWFVGRKRPNIKHSDRHRMVDYAWEPWPEQFVDKELDGSESPPPEAPKKADKPRVRTASPTSRTTRPGVPKSATPATASAASAKSG
jgi:intracellular multiplication protein IcmT